MVELPSLDDIIHLLQKCRKERIQSNAIHVYTSLCGHGFESQTAVGNHVIPTLVDCNCLGLAERAFEKLAHPNSHAWTSFITGFIDFGKADLSFVLYKRMLATVENPSSHTFVALLRACALLQDIEKGKEVHVQSDERGFKNDVFVGSALIDMYFACGVPTQAHEVFDKLPAQDVVVWNTLISGYVEHFYFEEGLTSFAKMTEWNCPPNVVSFVCALKACGHLANLKTGQEIHCEVILRAYETDNLVGNSLIDFYGKCKCFEDTQASFGSLGVRDVVSWNALITGYVDNEHHEKALKCYYEMQKEGILPDSVTFLCVLRACGGIGRIEKGVATSAQTYSLELKQHNFIGNTMVSMYAKCHFLAEAWKAFKERSCQDVVSWNALIAGYIENGLFDEALCCLTQMESQKTSPDVGTYIYMMKACCSLQKLDLGMDLHAEIMKRGLGLNPFLGSYLIEFYFTFGAVEEAEDSFKYLQVHDVMVWNAMISGCVDHCQYRKGFIYWETMQLARVTPDSGTFSACFKACGCIKDILKGRELHNKAAQVGLTDNIFVASCLADMYAKCSQLADAQDCVDRLAVQDATAWNTLVTGYVTCEASQEALECYAKMQTAGVSVNEVTFVCVLKACANLGVVEIGQSIHIDSLKTGFACNPQVSNALVNMYAKCGLFLEAYQVFLQLNVKDIVTWNTLINGFGLNYDGNKAVQVFEDMLENGMKPDAITFTCLFTSCSRSSLVTKGQELFRVMCDEFNILPSIHHYSCFLDLHARSGCIQDADKFWKTIPWFSSEVLLTVLLDACKNFVKAEAGGKYFNIFAQIYSKCASPHIICANAEGGVHSCRDIVEVKSHNCGEKVKLKEWLAALFCKE